MEKRVDIIIPVHNRWEHTKQTLDSLFENTDEGMFELYVIDDRSDPETENGLKAYKKISILKRNDIAIGPAASRNEMCEHITKSGGRKEFLYHSDNDVFFKRGWLGALLATLDMFEEDGLKLLGGGCHPYLQNNGIFSRPEIQYPYIVGLKDAVSGYSQLMRWETWDKYGPFSDANRNEEIKIMGSEDWAFCQKIIKDGYKVGSIEPELVIATGKTNTYGKLATGSETFKEVEGVVVK